MPYDLLDGVKVIELSMYAFAPASAAVLSDWGADVVKVERPGLFFHHRLGFLNRFAPRTLKERPFSKPEIVHSACGGSFRGHFSNARFR